MKIEKISAENALIEIIDLSIAIKELDGYWKKESIEPMLLQGQTLWTPFNQYKLLNQTK